MQMLFHNKDRSVEIGDIGMVWDNYFPEIEFSDKDPKIKLVKDLASLFFSEPLAENLLLSQVSSPDLNFFLNNVY